MAVEEIKWLLHDGANHMGSFSDSPLSNDKYKTIAYLRSSYDYAVMRGEYLNRKEGVLSCIQDEILWQRKRRFGKRIPQFVISHLVKYFTFGYIVKVAGTHSGADFSNLDGAMSFLFFASVIVSFVFFVKFMVAACGMRRHNNRQKELEGLYYDIHDEFQNMIDHDERIKPSSEIYLWLFPRMNATTEQIAVMINALKDGKASNFKEALLYYDEYTHRQFMEKEARIQTENTRIAAENAKKAANNPPTVIHRTYIYN